MSGSNVADCLLFNVPFINFLRGLSFTDTNQILKKKVGRYMSLEALACKTKFFVLSTYSFNYLKTKKYLKNHFIYHTFWVIICDFSCRLSFVSGEVGHSPAVKEKI